MGEPAAKPVTSIPALTGAGAQTAGLFEQFVKPAPSSTPAAAPEQRRMQRSPADQEMMDRLARRMFALEAQIEAAKIAITPGVLCYDPKGPRGYESPMDEIYRRQREVETILFREAEEFLK